jgi:uncharacterized protein YbjT (DUF2867 family)
MQADNNRIALVAGANGMVGVALVRTLVDSGDYTRVIALTRRPLSIDSPRLVNRILPFKALENEMKGLACHDAYCCLGTTRREAGSQQAFRAVDHDLVLSFARGAQAAGAQTLVVVSSIGADRASGNFYLRIKGETETALEALRFRALHLLQPGLLLGERRQRRLVETLARWTLPLFNPLLLGNYARYRAIEARVVAAAMRAAARSGRAGVLRYTYVAIQSLARSGRASARV